MTTSAHAAEAEAPRPGRVRGIIAALTAHIRENGLMPGDSLPSEAALAAEFAVSRPVVREALRALAALGLIELGAGRRARVARPDAEPLGLLIEHGVHIEQISIQQIYDARRAIETRTAELAALRRSEAEAEEIDTLAARMQAAIDQPEEVMELDLVFHRALAGAGRNTVFMLIVAAFDGVTRQTWPVGWRSRRSRDEQVKMLDLHGEIARAVRAGDPRRAHEAMALHFDESVRALLGAGIS